MAMIKTIQVTRTKTLKDGTVKTYTETRSYTVRGYMRKNAERSPKTVFSDEQRDEILSKYNSGIKVSRIALDYNTNYAAIMKVIRAYNENKEEPPIVRRVVIHNGITL